MNWKTHVLDPTPLFTRHVIVAAVAVLHVLHLLGLFLSVFLSLPVSLTLYLQLQELIRTTFICVYIYRLERERDFSMKTDVEGQESEVWLERSNLWMCLKRLFLDGVEILDLMLCYATISEIMCMMFQDPCLPSDMVVSSH